MIPSFESQISSGQSMQFEPLRAWKLRLTTSHGVPNMTWMSTWPNFLKVRFRTWIENWVEQKARSLDKSPTNIFAANEQDMPLLIICIFQWFLKAQTLGLGLHV